MAEQAVARVLLLVPRSIRVMQMIICCPIGFDRLCGAYVDPECVTDFTVKPWESPASLICDVQTNT